MERHSVFCFGGKEQSLRWRCDGVVMLVLELSAVYYVEGYV